MRKFFFTVSILFIPLFFVNAQIEDNLTLSITPPLIKNNINPGEKWVSAIKLINNNPGKIKIYTEVLDFKSKADGTIDLLPPATEQNNGQSGKYTLRQWLNIQEGPFEIEPFSSREIPFVIDVPEGADPGGHYAAILAGTRPYSEDKGTNINVSSMLASLVMLNIKGDVIESGRIREFTTDRTFYNGEKIIFKVKFENTGNVHLLPRGDIVIYDMYGKNRGKIPINRNTEFGNVLPGSARTWEFEWEPDHSFINMGRYRAELLVNFGDNGTTTDNRLTFFWIMNFKLLGITVGSLLAFFLLVFAAIRLYIRKAVISTQKKYGIYQQETTTRNEMPERTPRPISAARDKVVDLKNIKIK
jgi:hypothetical protein